MDRDQVTQFKREVIDVVTPKGSKTYIVGGTCRDLLDGQPINDIDITTNMEHEFLDKLIQVCEEQHLPYTLHQMNHANDITIKYPFEGREVPVKVEISQYFPNEEITGGDRDFTCNAIHWACEESDQDEHDFMYPVIEQTSIFKPVSFLWKEHMIQPVSSVVFITNPIRFFRAADLMCRPISYRPTATCSETAKFSMNNYLLTPIKRLEKRALTWRMGCMQILNKIFTDLAEGKRDWDKVLGAFNWLAEVGGWNLIDPRIQDMVLQEHKSKYHTDTIWHHTMEVMDGIDRIWNFEKPEWYYNLSRDYKVVLYWAALLHDIGKIPTISTDKVGNHHFIDHHNVGVDIVEDFIDDIPLSGSMKEVMTNLIRHHMDTKKFGEDVIKEKHYDSIRKLMFDMGSVDKLTLWSILNTADCWASTRKDKSFPAQPEVTKAITDIDDRINFGRETDWYHYKAPVRGDELQQELGCEPQHIGAYLKQIREMAFANPQKVATKEQAIAYAWTLAKDKEWKRVHLK